MPVSESRSLQLGEELPPEGTIYVSSTGHGSLAKSLKFAFGYGESFRRANSNEIPDFGRSEHVCFECGKEYQYESYLSRHYYAVHGGILVLKHPDGINYGYFFTHYAGLVKVVKNYRPI